MPEPIPSSKRPYKFLDYYAYDDRDIFFGRERETEILLSDIISARLVVLFAKTGTGKTSLINAGVRPRLEELDYATLYVRVERDPIESIRKAFVGQEMLSSDAELGSLALQLDQVVTRLEKPVVVFFDQFEEFFIYIFNENPDKAREFISEVASVYWNRESGVHFVFSMREKFFVEMDVFRDEIPLIFHNDSNLRLQWFDPDQARKAIVEPAQVLGVKIQEQLVEQLLLDLTEAERIEPARLQIICDTLWQGRSDSQILKSDYERLGGAKRILDMRLKEDFDRHLDDGELRSLEKLLPQLITERGTRQVRDFEELVTNFEGDRTSLRTLIDQMNYLGLIRRRIHLGSIYIEWTSDYLAERTGFLQDSVKTIRLRRRLDASIQRAKAKSSQLKKAAEKKPITEKDIEALFMLQTEYKAISEGASYLIGLSREELEFMFIAALEHGIDMRMWFERGVEREVNVWEILEDKIVTKEPIEQAENAVLLLGQIGTGQALKLMQTALKQDDLARLATDQLGRMGTLPAVELLESALGQEHLEYEVERALERASKSRNQQAAARANSILAQLPDQRETQPLVEGAKKHILEEPGYLPTTRELEEGTWYSLLRRIAAGKCLPILGANIMSDGVPMDSEIAKQLAESSDYPFSNRSNLAEVAQYSATKYDSLYSKEVLGRWFLDAQPPDFNEQDEPHALLADLPLPVYLTTKYDDFMERALAARGKTPVQRILRWNRATRDPSSIFESDPGFDPSPERPLVYHLFGHYQYPESLVLTSDDYLDFLVNISRDTMLLPVRIQEALTSSSLLFLGYRPEDQSFRVLSRGLIAGYEGFLRRINIIQLPPVGAGLMEGSQAEIQGYVSYLNYYFDAMTIRIYWGTARQFAAELRGRWSQFSAA